MRGGSLPAFCLAPVQVLHRLAPARPGLSTPFARPFLPSLAPLPLPPRPRRCTMAAAGPPTRTYVSGDLDHVALDVADVHAVLPFYTDVLGLEPLRLAEFNGGKVPFPSVRVNAGTILDFFQGAPDGSAAAPPPPPKGAAGHLCLRLDKRDWEAVLCRVCVAGLPAGEVRQLSGARGMGTSVYLSDPEGNKVEIRYYPDA
eukprot:TRINITY_DN4307_c0_g1_i1.p1 TRINITY_DN4307_c0_g1~~TRINITY_DN4307_c0_g1_i1.p1  ORF type:complete len:200 (+),score=53.63 TRINITY_DN4307_c0_g1_i1:194-793(+)